MTQRNASVAKPWGPALKGVVSVALAIVALGGAAMGVHYGWEVLKSTDRLRVASITVTGNVRTTASEIEAYTGVRAGEPIFGIDLDVVAARLRRHPWVDSARVRRRLPDHLAIEITEHAPAILVALDEIYLANQSGEVFKRVLSSDDLVLPVVTGLSRARVAAAPEKSAAVIREAIALAALVAKSALGRLDELHWDRDLGWSVVTAPPRPKPVRPVRIQMGFDAAARIEIAERALEELESLRRRPQVIWVDGNKNPSRVHVKLLAQAASTESQETLIAKAGN